MSYKEKIICPKCNALHHADREQIPTDGRKSAKCGKCRSRFYVETRCYFQNHDPEVERTPIIVSYFEKRSTIDRRRGIERRKQIDRDSLPFVVPQSKDIIPFFDKEDVPVGYFSEGRRTGMDRRNGKNRRAVLLN